MIGPYGNGQVADYTEEIQLIPNVYGKIQNLGLFTPFGVNSEVVVLDREEQDLVILKEVPRGAPATRSKGSSRDYLPLVIPHIPHDDQIRPADIQGKRMPGSTDAETLTRVRMQKMENLRMKQALTLEFLRMGAIKGIITGGSGNTIYNLYTEFGLTIGDYQKDLALSVDGTEVPALLGSYKRQIEDDLEAGMGLITGWHCYCGTTFFDNLTSHPKVTDAFQYYTSSQNMLRNDVREGFLYKGIMFEEYNSSFSLSDGTASKMVADTKAYLFPVGVPNMFRSYFAPADKLDYVNTMGQEVYMFEYPGDKGKWIDLESESNPLPINTRPQGVIEITAT